VARDLISVIYRFPVIALHEAVIRIHGGVGFPSHLIVVFGTHRAIGFAGCRCPLWVDIVEKGLVILGE
jgi:hypothetical protein